MRSSPPETVGATRSASPLRLLKAPESDFYLDDRLFVKQIILKRAGMVAPVHSHGFDHVTMLAMGIMDVWLDGRCVGRMTAPKPIPIKAGTKHLFVSVAPWCVFYCIHAIVDGEIPHDPHELTEYSEAELSALLGKIAERLAR